MAKAKPQSYLQGKDLINWQQTNLKTNKNSAPTLFVVPPFNVTEMRHFKNHQNDGPSWLKLKIALIILAAWINGGHSDEKPGIFQYPNKYEKRRDSNNYVIRLGNSYQKK